MAQDATHTDEKRNTYKIWSRNLKEDHWKWSLRIKAKGLNWTHQAQDRNEWQTSVFRKGVESYTTRGNVGFSRQTQFHAFSWSSWNTCTNMYLFISLILENLEVLAEKVSTLGLSGWIGHAEYRIIYSSQPATQHCCI